MSHRIATAIALSAIVTMTPSARGGTPGTPDSAVRLQDGGQWTTVAANQPWQDVGVVLNPGDRVRLKAEGTWGDASGPTDADGHQSRSLKGSRADIPVSGAPAMLLVGRVADGPAFRVGSSAEIRATPNGRAEIPLFRWLQSKAGAAIVASGRLYLMANQRFDAVQGNIGQLTVRIVRLSCRTSTSLIRANQPWQDTGVAIRVGDVITIRSSGTWRGSDGETGPDGQFFKTPSGALVPLPGSPLMLLAGRIGQQAPFPVGALKEFTGEADGRIELMPNESVYAVSRNSGYLNASIEVCRTEGATADSSR